MPDQNNKEHLTAAQEKQMGYLSQSIRLEEAVHPRLVRMTILSICASVLAFTAWAAVTNINEVARAPGEVVPQGFQQIVQHFDGGIVREILVNEGETVEQGQILLRLDGAGAQEDLNRAHGQQVSYLMQKERLKANLEKREPDFSAIEGVNDTLTGEQLKMFDAMEQSRVKEAEIIREQIKQKEHSVNVLETQRATIGKNLSLAQDMYDRRKKLFDSGYVSRINFLQTEQELNSIRGEYEKVHSQTQQARAELTEYEGRLLSLSANNEDQIYKQLDQVEQALKQNSETIAKLQGRVDRLEVKAPVRGLVKGLAINTVGGVVMPGQSLMEILPLDKPLVVEVKIAPQYIGPMKPGQPVQVKVSSYDFSRYGAVSGKLEFISATTFQGERGERFYRGRVVLDHNYVGRNAAERPIMPGMTVMTDIITGRKTILAYLLKPIHRSLMTSFSET